MCVCGGGGGGGGGEKEGVEDHTPTRVVCKSHKSTSSSNINVFLP